MSAIQPDYQTPRRMALKHEAIPLPRLAGKDVLDVGCDMGHWSFLAARAGASKVLGLDRNRDVRGVGHVDLIHLNRRRAESDRLAVCSFEEINIGKQWRTFGKFDVILVLSVYHHIYEAAGGDHEPVWYWLWQHAREGATLIWEGPVDSTDPVVRANVSEAHRVNYTRSRIVAAASAYFSARYVGPALHEPTREVWEFTAPIEQAVRHDGVARRGAGGATAAFEHARGRRIGEIEQILGVRPVPGSLNVRLVGPFDWSYGYYRAQVLDVVERGKGLDVEWVPRWARFAPVVMESGHDAYAFRFEGEKYDANFIELISEWRLRDMLSGDAVQLCRR